MNKKKEVLEFRKRKIKETPKNPTEEMLRDNLLKLERGTDIEPVRINKEKIRSFYYKIIDILKKYIELKEEYYPLVSLWIIGSYHHDRFNSYPYLFLNAMRGSGKSRALKLITTLSKDGQVMASPTEAVLFRTKGTLAIDEFEGVSSKEKSAIRELLNASYKKGTFIMRMKKKKTIGGEEMVVEKFETYRPILIANIWGMDEVLGDRCIQLILEKSNNPIVTKLIEDFQENNYIQELVKSLCECSLCSVVSLKNIYKEWNNYIINKYSNQETTLTTLTYNTNKTTITTQTTSTINDIKMMGLFNKIEESGIQGRNLELFLPLFFLAMELDDLILKETIETASKITKDKTHEEEMESSDVMVYDFISKKYSDLTFHSVKMLTDEFKQFINESEEWLNSKWFGRALKRLNLVVDKRRTHQGIEVILNIPKAKEKIRMFRTGEENAI